MMVWGLFNSIESVHDRMTEEPYLTPLTSFKMGIEPAPIKTYPVLARGKDELRDVGVEFQNDRFIISI